MTYVLPQAAPDPFNSVLDRLGWRRVASNDDAAKPDVVVRWLTIADETTTAELTSPEWRGRSALGEPDRRGEALAWFDLAMREGRIPTGHHALIRTTRTAAGGVLAPKADIIEERIVSLAGAA